MLLISFVWRCNQAAFHTCLKTSIIWYAPELNELVRNTHNSVAIYVLNKYHEHSGIISAIAELFVFVDELPEILRTSMQGIAQHC